MAKKSQKTASNVEVTAPATTPKSAIKGKRGAGDAIEKKLSNKKQKNDVGGAQGATVKKGGGKKQKKKVAPKTQKEEAVKKQESSDASSASESEEEHEVVDAEVGAAAKDGPLSATKKTEESGSEDEDGNDSDEDDDAALSGDEEKEESSDDDAKSDDDDDDDASDDEMVEATAKPAAEKKKETKPSSTKSKASPSNTLFIGNMAFSVEKADVENFFEDCGGVVDVRIGTRPDGSSKGFAHVEFATVEAAQKALDEKNGEDLEGRPVRLDFAAEKGAYTPQNNKDAGSNQKGPGSRSQTVYVRGFDKSVEENDIKDALREHFSSCGEITRISVPRDDDGCKGFAYIDFASSEGVSKAQDLDQSELNDYPLTVEEAKPRGDRGGGGGGGRFKSERGGGRRGGGRFGGRGGGGRGGGGGGGGGGRGGGGRGRGRGGGGRGRGRGRW